MNVLDRRLELPSCFCYSHRIATYEARNTSASLFLVNIRWFPDTLIVWFREVVIVLYTLVTVVFFFKKTLISLVTRRPSAETKGPLNMNKLLDNY